MSNRLGFRMSVAVLFTVLFAMTCTAGDFEKWEKRDDWQNVDGIIKALGIGAGSVVADIGAQRGYLTLRLAPLVGDAGRVYAVDIDGAALKKLKKNLKTKSISNVEVIKGKTDNPKLPAGTLDAVVILNAYHEMDDYQKILKHVHRALKPGGRLVIVDNISDEYEASSREEQIDEHELDIDFAEADLKAAGFSIIRRDGDFCKPRWHDRMWLLAAHK